MPPSPSPTAPPAARDRILAACLPLFAAAGYSGVSMRDVAGAVGVTPAALYHHFPDKDQLYLALIAHVYHDRIPALIAGMATGGDPWQRLESLVAGVIHMNVHDRQLLRFAQWILLDTDEARTRRLADNVFAPFLHAVAQLAADLGGGYEPHRLSLSVLSLLMFPFQSETVTRHVEGFRAPQDEPDALARHVVRLLREGIGGGAR